MTKKRVGLQSDKQLSPNDIPNPFQEWKAEEEKARLELVYVRAPHHADIFRDEQSPHTFFAFALQGAGKTTCRLMLERRLRPAARDSKGLAVNGLTMEAVQTELGGSLVNLQAEAHWHLITHAILLSLLRDFLIAPQPFLNLSPLRQAHLTAFFQRHLTFLKNPLQLADELRASGHAPLADAIEYDDAARANGLQAQLQFLNALRQLRSVDFAPTPLENLRTLLNLAERCGFTRICILIDGVDNYLKVEETDAALAFLMPLCEALPQLETLPISFQFFLPLEWATPLSKKGVRFDRYPRYDLEWTDEMLFELLRQRLVSVSDGEIVSLGQLARDDPEGDAVPLSKRLDQELVQNAYGSPRRLLMIVSYLFAAFHQRVGQDKFFVESDLTWALETYRRQHGRLIPLLIIDEAQARAYIGGWELDLTAKEFECLVFLRDAKGEPRKKDQVWKRLYPDQATAPSQAQSDTFFSRLRQKLERNPKKPVYLIHEREIGYRLENVR